MVFESGLVTVVCTSDTHNDDCTQHMPLGDIFLHAGDFTDNGTLEELESAYAWISKLPHKLKIVVAGRELKFKSKSESKSRSTHDLTGQVRACCIGRRLLNN
jgi:predicted phosphodiesterase